jgi:hypothetical protein
MPPILPTLPPRGRDTEFGALQASNLDFETPQDRA